MDQKSTERQKLFHNLKRCWHSILILGFVFQNRTSLFGLSPSYEGEQGLLTRRRAFGSKSSTLHSLFDTLEDESLVCSVCGKTFSGCNRKPHLRRHMITHSGVKPHACPHCPHRTNRSENLRLHIRLKHPLNFVFQS